MKQNLIIKLIKKHIEEEVDQNFSGLGLIMVNSDTDSLPISPLLKEKEDLSIYKNENEIVDFLFKISHYKDNRHDGFHIINQEKGLIKISQYFSPCIPKDYEGIIYDVGARYRTSQFGSLYESVSSIIIVSQSGKISIARNGTVEVLVK